MSLDVVVGLDVGGTNARAAVATMDGEILYTKKLPTSAGPELADHLSSLVREAVDEYRTEESLDKVNPRAIVTSIAGLVETEEGVLRFSPNIKDANSIQLEDTLTEAYDVPVKIVNDGNAAALGVLKKDPQAKEMKNIVYVIMGSGIGGGVVIDGKLYTGADGFAGEIGHVTVDYDDDALSCGCSRQGCWEAYSSGTGMVKLAEKMRSEKEYATVLTGEIKSENIFEAFHDGDPLAQDVVGQAAVYNKRALENLTHILNPEAFFFGESLLNNEEQILPPLRGRLTLMQGYNQPGMYRTQVEDPALHGAVHAAIDLAYERGA